MTGHPYFINCSNTADSCLDGACSVHWFAFAGVVVPTMLLKFCIGYMVFRMMMMVMTDFGLWITSYERKENGGNGQKKIRRRKATAVCKNCVFCAAAWGDSSNDSVTNVIKTLTGTYLLLIKFYCILLPDYGVIVPGRDSKICYVFVWYLFVCWCVFCSVSDISETDGWIHTK